MRTRQARIRQPYEAWFPTIEPGIWHNAAWMAERVLQQQRRGSPTWALDGRVLQDKHIEFRGYGPLRRKFPLSRRSDLPTHQ
ncbi:MAG TPA: hypothetical protein VFD73_03690 [Gemmatimonadales bacterium]|nr:hypothetical protein [Gemmatimonadales bacterium]